MSELFCFFPRVRNKTLAAEHYLPVYNEVSLSEYKFCCGLLRTFSTMISHTWAEVWIPVLKICKHFIGPKYVCFQIWCGLGKRFFYVLRQCKNYIWMNAISLINNQCCYRMYKYRCCCCGHEKRVMFKIYSGFIYIVMSMHNLYVNMIWKVLIPVLLLWTYEKRVMLVPT